MSMPLLFGMMVGHWELLVVAGVMLLLFGHRLPSLMRSLGRGVVEFKKGVHGIEDDVETGQVEGESRRSAGESKSPGSVG